MADEKVRNGVTVLDLYLTLILKRDEVKRAAETHIAASGSANQGGGIYTTTFIEKQRVVVDGRGHLAAKGDVTRSREIITENHGGGGTVTDASGTLISTDGSTNSTVEITTISGTPPVGWKPMFARRANGVREATFTSESEKEPSA